MRKTEIDQFVRTHTVEFETELVQKAKRTVASPSPSFAKTAAINLMRRRRGPVFDQDQIIQQQVEKLALYIISVSFSTENFLSKIILDH